MTTADVDSGYSCSRQRESRGKSHSNDNGWSSSTKEANAFRRRLSSSPSIRLLSHSVALMTLTEPTARWRTRAAILPPRLCSHLAPYCLLWPHPVLKFFAADSSVVLFLFLFLDSCSALNEFDRHAYTATATADGRSASRTATWPTGVWRRK